MKNNFFTKDFFKQEIKTQDRKKKKCAFRLPPSTLPITSSTYLTKSIKDPYVLCLLFIILNQILKLVNNQIIQLDLNTEIEFISFFIGNELNIFDLFKIN